MTEHDEYFECAGEIGPEAEAALKAMIGADWPHCKTCGASLFLGAVGFLCIECNGPTVPFNKTKYANSFQVNAGTLRKLFPNRCLNT